MDGVQAALMTMWNAVGAAALRVLVPGGLWFVSAPQARPTSPYIVASYVADRYEGAFGGRRTEIQRLRFTFYTPDDEQLAAVRLAMDAFKPVFDYTGFTVTGGGVVHMTRSGPGSLIPDGDGGFMGVLEYEYWYKTA